MLSEADLSPLSLAAPSTGARPKSRKKHQQQSGTSEGAAVNGVSGVDKENEDDMTFWPHDETYGEWKKRFELYKQQNPEDH